MQGHEKRTEDATFAISGINNFPQPENPDRSYVVNN